ncbi:TPA: hypothetical protein ACH3X3_009171 [Trebouxia sp. C0006]
MLMAAAHVQLMLQAAQYSQRVTHFDSMVWDGKLVQGFSKLITGLVARYWQGSANAAVAHPAYSHIGLPNRDLFEQRKCLLHLANITPTQVEDWRYFGKHALPLVLKTWVELANNSMRQHERAKPQEEPILIIDVYIITLSCYRHTRAQGDTAPYPGGAALALMKAIFICLCQLAIMTRELALLTLNRCKARSSSIDTSPCLACDKCVRIPNGGLPLLNSKVASLP